MTNLMKMQHIQGILVPRTPSAVTPTTRSQIAAAVHKSHLFLTIKDVHWDEGIVEINSYTAAEKGKATIHFLHRLGTFLNEEGVAELRLKGHLMITVDTEKNPLVVRATVKDGQITYQQAKVVWDTEPIVLPSLSSVSTSV